MFSKSPPDSGIVAEIIRFRELRGGWEQGHVPRILFVMVDKVGGSSDPDTPRIITSQLLAGNILAPNLCPCTLSP